MFCLHSFHLLFEHSFSIQCLNISLFRKNITVKSLDLFNKWKIPWGINTLYLLLSLSKSIVITSPVHIVVFFRLYEWFQSTVDDEKRRYWEVLCFVFYITELCYPSINRVVRSSVSGSDPSRPTKRTRTDSNWCTDRQTAHNWLDHTGETYRLFEIETRCTESRDLPLEFEQGDIVRTSFRFQNSVY